MNKLIGIVGKRLSTNLLLLSLFKKKTSFYLLVIFLLQFLFTVLSNTTFLQKRLNTIVFRLTLELPVLNIFATNIEVKQEK